MATTTKPEDITPDDSVVPVFREVMNASDEAMRAEAFKAFQEIEAQAAATESARASAQKKLAALGLTPAEVQAITG
jgi:hypothetical protein